MNKQLHSLHKGIELEGSVKAWQFCDKEIRGIENCS